MEDSTKAFSLPKTHLDDTIDKIQNRLAAEHHIPKKYQRLHLANEKGIIKEILDTGIKSKRLRKKVNLTIATLEDLGFDENKHYLILEWAHPLWDASILYGVNMNVVQIVKNEVSFKIDPTASSPQTVYSLTRLVSTQGMDVKELQQMNHDTDAPPTTTTTTTTTTTDDVADIITNKISSDIYFNIDLGDNESKTDNNKNSDKEKDKDKDKDKVDKKEINKDNVAIDDYKDYVSKLMSKMNSENQICLYSRELLSIKDCPYGHPFFQIKLINPKSVIIGLTIGSQIFKSNNNNNNNNNGIVKEYRNEFGSNELVYAIHCETGMLWSHETKQWEIAGFCKHYKGFTQLKFVKNDVLGIKLNLMYHNIVLYKNDECLGVAFCDVAMHKFSVASDCRLMVCMGSNQSHIDVVKYEPDGITDPKVLFVCCVCLCLFACFFGYFFWNDVTSHHVCWLFVYTRIVWCLIFGIRKFLLV